MTLPTYRTIVVRAVIAEYDADVVIQALNDDVDTLESHTTVFSSVITNEAASQEDVAEIGKGETP